MTNLAKSEIPHSLYDHNESDAHEQLENYLDSLEEVDNRLQQIIKDPRIAEQTKEKNKEIEKHELQMVKEY